MTGPLFLGLLRKRSQIRGLIKQLCVSTLLVFGKSRERAPAELLESAHAMAVGVILSGS